MSTKFGIQAKNPGILKRKTLQTSRTLIEEKRICQETEARQTSIVKARTA